MFFAPVRSIAVFPPIPASTWRDRGPGHAAHVRRGSKARDVGRGPAPERDDPAIATDPERLPETSEYRARLRRLARGHLVRDDVARAERDLSADAVDPGDVLVDDELHRPLAGHELLEAVERAELHVHTGSGEEDPVDVRGARVGDRLVDRLTLSVQGVELVLRLRERPVAAGDTLPRGLGLHVDQHGECARAQGVARPLGEHRASPEGDDHRLAAAEDVERHLPLHLPEAALASRCKQGGDARAGAGLDLTVEVDERPTEPRRDLAAQAALARSHEPGERQVPAERVQVRGSHRSPIRAR